ncbi:MAG: alpha/beta fold hydrolase, partial [Oryzihumus sp.]
MITAAGLTVHEPGDAEAAGPLVLLHGLTDSGQCWPDAVRRWGPSYRLFAADLRGHGTSPRFTRAQLEAGPGDVLLADTVGLVEDVVELTGSPVVLVGHSMGAGLAGAAAAVRSDLVRAAVLEEPAWGILRDEAEVERLALERTAWVQEFRDDLAAAMAKG